MAHIELREQHGILRGPFDMRDRDIIGSMPERVRWQLDGTVHFNLSLSCLEYITRAFPQHPAVAELIALRDARRQSIIGHTLPEESHHFAFKTEPMAHQASAFQWARNRKLFALFMEMGTGKTKTTLDILADKWSRGEIDRVLVIAPNGVQRQWVRDEIPKHLPDWVARFAHVYKAKRLPREIVVPERAVLTFLCVNVEQFSLAHRLPFFAEWIRDGKTAVVVDESTRIKTPSAKRTKNIIGIARAARVRAILTGAPVTRHVTDLWSQFKFLDEDLLGFKWFSAFRAYFCELQPIRGAPMGAVKIVGVRNVSELTTKVERYSYRITKEDALDLPPKIYVERRVALTTEQRRAYIDLKEEFMTFLSEGRVIAANAAARLMRMQQVVCGFMPHINGAMTEFPQHRTQAMLDVMEECGDRVVVWGRFQHDIDVISRALTANDIDHVCYDGRNTVAERDEAIAEWRSGRVRAFVGNPAAAGIGLNLQGANTVIYYSNSFNAEHRWQSEDRTHRIGTTGSVTYIDLVATGTLDRLLLTSLRDKKSIADLVIDTCGEGLGNGDDDTEVSDAETQGV